MSQEKSESRKQFVDYMLELNQQDELAEAKERINKKVDALRKELGEIADRAYQTAIVEKVGEYQEKANVDGLTSDEIEIIHQERKDFEANPEKYGIKREKCPIKDEADQRRAMEIVELLKDTKQLGNIEEPDFLKMIDGYAERHAQKTEAQNKQVSENGD